MKNQITNLITKIISILVIMLMMVNSSLMLVISVAVDAVQKIIDETKINAVYELNMEKYVNYKMGDKQGTLVQTYLKTGIEYQEGQEYVPIDTSNVIINTPKINDKYPESVEVVTKSTKATNGDGSGKDVNYAYNKENGQLQINTENKADDKGNIYTENVAGARDEYQLDFYYDADCYNDKNEKRSLEFKGNVELKLKDDRDIRKNQEISQNFEVAENVSGLVSADITTSDIYNGHINANIQNNSTYRTEYTENVKIQTSFKEIADEITVNSKNLLVNNKDKENETQEIIYKNTKVNKNEILDKLGQDGYFQIIDKDGNILATINKDTEADENGNVQIGYDGEKTELNFKFSKPLKLGDINILNTKEIKDTMKDENVTKVETRNTVSCVNNVTEKTKVIDEETKEEKEVENTKQVEIYNYVGTSVAEIKEAKTDVKVTANNTNWTNNVQNDVTFTATLVTSGPEYNLFKNPVIDIKLPNEVEKVVLGESSILYDSGLQLGSVQVVDDNGSKVIRVKVNGTQTSYVQNEVVNGANIVIPASIILKKDIVSSQENIAVSFANYRNAKSPETGNLDIPVNVTSIINNNASANEQNSNNGASANGVATNFAAVSAQATLATANNTVVEAKPIDLDKISVEYKAFLGDKELANGDSVHENEYIKYVAKVRNNTGEDVNGLNVVASVPEGTTYVTIENRELTEDEKQTEKYDKCTITKFPEQKEFLTGISLKKDEEKEIYFYVKANELTNNINTLDITSTIKMRSGDIEKICATVENVVNNALLTVSLRGWETLRGLNIWRFVINVKNNTDKTLNNINIDVLKDDKFTFSEENTEDKFTENDSSWRTNVENLPAGGSTEKVIYLKARTADVENDEIDMLATASVNENKYYSNPNIQFINNPNFTITQYSDREGEKIKYGETVEYVYTIQNNAWLAYLCPLTLRDFLDDNMEALSAEYENYVINNGKYEKEVLIMDLHSIPEGEEQSVDAKIDMYVPDGESIKIKIKATPRIVYEEEETTNYGVLSYNYNDVDFSRNSNIIKNTILPYNYEEPDPDNPNPDKPDPDNPDPDNPNPDKPDPDDPNPDNPSENKYNISGLVWKDENKNGIRESSEMLLSGITVKLFNIDTNEIVVVDNNKQITTTNQSGEYTFSGVGKGNYIVLFEYDVSKYKLTTYKSNTASDDTNSDVINKSVSIDGNEKEVGVTDTINISNQNKTHIDMGLIENGTYDLSLNKYITNVELTYGSQKQTYSYDNSKLAKVEIPAKKVDNVKVTIEYKIEVKNEGNVDAIIESIADYKPDGLDFDKSLNSGWNIDNQNNLTNVSMLGGKLEPGKTKSVTLYLTKTLSKDSMGTFTNSAEILKSLNFLNLKDVDSTEGNKDRSEDDYSEAQIVISVKTGVVLYASIFFGVILLMIGMILLIKTKKIKISKLRSIAISMIAGFGIIVIGLGNNSYAVECWYETTKRPDTYKSWFYAKDENGNVTTTVEYTNNYYHHDPESNKKLSGQADLYCSEGGLMANKDNVNDSWTYEKKGMLAPEKPVATGDKWLSDGKVAQISSFGLSGATVKIKSDSKYILVGPFVANFYGKPITYDGSQHGCYVKGKKTANQKPEIISGASFANSSYENITPTSGNEFYVKIPISEKIITLSEIQFGCWSYPEYSQKQKVIVHEKWGVKYKHDGAQILTNNIEKNYGDSEAPDECLKTWHENSYADKSIVTDIDITGSIKITKNDTDTKDSLNGAQFRITGPNNYDKTVKIEKDGTITIKDLLVGEYTVTETGAPTNYRLNIQDNTTTTVNVTGGGTVDAKFTNKQYGDLTVTKKDKDTGNTSIGGEVLKGIKFKLYINKNGKKYYLKNTSPTKYSYSDFSVEESNISNAKTFTTDDNAQFSISNLPVYEGQNEIIYNVEEYEIPDNLKEYYELKPRGDMVARLKNGNTVFFDVLNPQKYVHLSGYVWEDVANPNKQTTRNDLYDEGETMVSGITVRLKSTIREKVHPNGKGDINNDGKVDSTDLMQLLYYVSGRDENLSVDAINRGDINNDGKANIQDLVLLLRILEDGNVTSLGYGKGDLNADGVIDLSDMNIVLNHVSGGQIIIEDNVKYAADINGDGVVNTKDLMLLVQGVAPSVITVQDEGTIQTTTTNASGQYKFNKVKIDQLSNYYIEFEYNGLKYQSVAYHNQDNGSKAIEGDTTRDNFNKQYASITGGNAKGTTTTGYSKNASGTVTNNLTYTNGTYSSQLVQNTGYTVGSAKKSVSAQNGSSGVSIKATTSAANHSLATWSAGVVKLENINLGIYKRQQSDMKIATDLKDIGLTFNGYNHTYTYNKRTAKQGIDIFSELQKWNKTDEQKVNENDQYPRKYETSIYKNYAYASASEGDKNGNGKIDDKYKLKMYLNYKIEIKNSSSVYMSANEIARYYNNILTYSSSYYIDKNGNKHDITWNEKADANGYKQIRTTGLSNVKIEPGSSLTVYLTLQIKDDIIKEFGLGSRIDAICQGVTEITSYSNYTSDGKYYAAIDKNSAPDNIKLGDINTYEDDTDSAPELKITLKEPKTITGYVFEDKTSDDLLTNQERKGNGKFDNGENTVGKVKVELIEQTNGKEAYIYPNAVSELNLNAVPATYTTKANGYYEFVGVVPGKYYIKYTYSNGSVVYKGTNEVKVSTQDYKSTIISSKTLRDAYGDTEVDDLGSVNNNDRWYQDTNIETYSTAVDDYATRKSINNTYSTIIASKKVDYDKGVGQQEMTARTLNMNMAIENYNNEVTNMNENRTSLYKNLDFGIAIRPRQSLKLDKKVTYVKLTLSGGDTVAEGNPSNENELKTMNYVTYPKGGKLKIEADDEIIQGATLEIKYTIYVTNNSEKDYNNVAYYRYGTKKDNPVKLSINTIVDYIDQKVPTEYTNVAKSSGGWYVSTDQQIKDLTTKAAYNDVKSRKNILLSDCNKTISIGETMATEPVEASKVMASSEDVDIKNYAEAVKVSNSVGRFYGGIVNSEWVNMTPGNLQVSSDTAIDESHELDDDGVEVVVVPSTGDNTIIYYILGITCLGIIVCGIVLIKKLVL